MEVKPWTYEEIPEFDDEVPGAEIIDTTGNEIGVTYIRDVVYETIGGLDRHLQILIPNSRNYPAPKVDERKPSRNYPCIVYVQGSAWMKQDCYFNLPNIAKLAARGYVVAVVEYRQSGIGVFPDFVRDAHNAVRFMRTFAKEFAVIEDQIAIMGDSSGGHTATYAGILKDDDSPFNLFPGVSANVSCIVNYYGSTDLTFDDSNPQTTNHNLPDSPEGQAMGGINLRENTQAMNLLTCRTNIDADTDFPPIIHFHGTKDRTVNTRCSTLLHEHLLACGHESRLYLIKGADHGGPEFWTDEVLDIVDGFVRSHL